MKRPKIALGTASLLWATTTLMGGCMFLSENILSESSPSATESPEASESPAADESPSPSPSDDSSPKTREGKVVFMLINETNRPMERFFASPSQIDDWEEDIFGDKVLPPNKRVRITIDDGRKDCMYDFKATLGPTPDGSVGRGDMVQTKINICTLDNWGFRENQ